jgi:hypothetical protein
MIRKYSQLKSAANEEQDLYFRNKANIAYELVRDFLKQMSETPHLPSFVVPVDNREGYAVKASKIEEKFSAEGNIQGKHPLIFIFAHSREKNQNTIMTGGFGWTPNKKYAVIILNFLIKPYDFKHADTRLNKQTFVHEYIHYLDACRRKDKLESPEVKRNLPLPDLDISDEAYNYFNDPAEMNSYYQEAAISIKNVLNKIKEFNPERFFSIMQNFISFKEDIVYFFKEDWIKNLSPENSRKFNKRLYNLYVNLKEEMG